MYKGGRGKDLGMGFGSAGAGGKVAKGDDDGGYLWNVWPKTSCGLSCTCP